MNHDDQTVKRKWDNLQFIGEGVHFKAGATLSALREFMVDLDASLEDDIEAFKEAAKRETDHVLRVIVSDDGRSARRSKLPCGKLDDAHLKALSQGILNDRAESRQAKRHKLHLVITAVLTAVGTLAVQWSVGLFT